MSFQFDLYSPRGLVLSEYETHWPRKRIRPSLPRTKAEWQTKRRKRILIVVYWSYGSPGIRSWVLRRTWMARRIENWIDPKRKWGFAKAKHSRLPRRGLDSCPRVWMIWICVSGTNRVFSARTKSASTVTQHWDWTLKDYDSHNSWPWRNFVVFQTWLLPSCSSSMFQCRTRVSRTIK